MIVRGFTYDVIDQSSDRTWTCKIVHNVWLEWGVSQAKVHLFIANYPGAIARKLTGGGGARTSWAVEG